MRLNDVRIDLLQCKCSGIKIQANNKMHALLTPNEFVNAIYNSNVHGFLLQFSSGAHRITTYKTNFGLSELSIRCFTSI